MTHRWRQRPEGSNWGDFGADDQYGRLNLLTPERVVRAIAEVKVGKTFCLSLPLDLPGGNKLMPGRHPPTRVPTERRDHRHCVNYPFSFENAAYTDIECDDAVTISTQYSTQWDGLAHMGQYFDADGDGVPEPVYYNGYRAGADVVDAAAEGGAGARALGIEKMAETCVQGRGVLVDLYRHFGAEQKFVGYDELMAVLQTDGVVVEEGDMLCLHTGYGDAVLRANGDPDVAMLHHSHAVLNGREARLLRWIEESGISVLIADNFAVEGYPAEPPSSDRYSGLPLHEKCLFKLGIHLGELWHLTPLAAWLRQHNRSRFLLTAPPLRLTGSFGSPVTPVATV